MRLKTLHLVSGVDESLIVYIIPSFPSFTFGLLYTPQI